MCICRLQHVYNTEPTRKVANSDWNSVYRCDGTHLWVDCLIVFSWEKGSEFKLFKMSEKYKTV